MPPVLPYVQAALYKLTDFNSAAVIEIVLGIQALSIMSIGMIVLHEARRLGVTFLGYTVFMVGLCANFSQFFQITHDVWLLTLVVNLLWLGLVNYWHPEAGYSRAVVWGIFGGFAALCSPIVGLSWAVLTTMRSFGSFGLLCKVH